MNPLLAEQYRVSPAKTQGLAVGLGGIFFGRMERRRLKSRTATPVYSFCALPGGAGPSMGARGGVPEFESPSILFVHPLHGNFLGEIRIHENHITEFQSGGFHYRFESLQRQINLSDRIVWHRSRLWIPPLHGRDKQTILREDAGRIGFRSFIIGRDHRAAFGQLAHRNRGYLYRWLR